MNFPRSSGLLLHVTSLPNGHGSGDLGEAAFRFVDFLQQAGQTIWQILPLGPTAAGDSPYSCYSAFAGNPLLISLTELVKHGLLDEADLPLPSHDSDKVDFPDVGERKRTVLEASFQYFRLHAGHEEHDKFNTFCVEHSNWLVDFARFEALRQHFGSTNWIHWDEDLVRRSDQALAAWDAKLKDEIEFAKYVQFVFYSQWQRLKGYANQRDVRIFGDMPIFVSHESADVWANQKMFFLDDAGHQTVVAGVPPDYFSETGQLWGNPLYRWDRMCEDDYAWWTQRFRSAFMNFDLLRIDHFRGFESYWEVPAEAETAIDGDWATGPGAAPFLAAQQALGELPIVAEDLGLITDDVHALRDELGFPGMRVFQFGFDTEDDTYHRPESFPEHSAAYTGTHDNDTIVGWYRQRKVTRNHDHLLDSVVSPDATEPHIEIIRAVFESASHTAIAPLQDLLGLGSESRMNTPGVADGNWKWRCSSTDLSTELADRLRKITESTGRLATQSSDSERPLMSIV